MRILSHSRPQVFWVNDYSERQHYTTLHTEGQGKSREKCPNERPRYPCQLTGELAEPQDRDRASRPGETLRGTTQLAGRGCKDDARNPMGSTFASCRRRSPS